MRANTQLHAYLASQTATWHNVVAITGPLLIASNSRDLGITFKNVLNLTWNNFDV